MRLFGRKKKDAEPDYQKIMQDMYAPKISENLDPWFKKFATTFPPKSIFESTATIQPNAWFNVEVAAMQISTRIPTECETCSNSDDSHAACQSCGKNSSNFTSVMTANADGDYLGWEIYSSEELFHKKLSDGYFVSFDKSVNINFDGSKIQFESQDLAPILVNTLNVKPYTQDIGMLFFADAFATLDGKDYISGIRVPEGNYSVIAWIGYTMTGELSPMAVTVLGEKLMSGLDFEVKGLEAAPEDVKKCVTNSISGTVFARFGADLEGLARANSDFYNKLNDIEANIADSWLIQHVHKENPDIYSQVESDYLQDIGGALWLIESFRIRGQQKIAMEKMKLIEEEIKDLDNSEINETYKLVYDNMKKFPPGSHAILIFSNITLDQLSEADELNNQGWRAYQSGNKDEGYELLRRSAMLGQPNALANYTWFALREGKFKEAIELHEAAIAGCKNSHDSYMVTNCIGNFALNLAAVGQLDKAIAVSEECLDVEMYEIHFFLALMYLEKGDREAAKRTFALIPISSHAGIKKTLTEEFSDGSGWFSEWCGKGIAAFKEFSR